MGIRMAGVAYVKVDGSQLPLRGNLTVSPTRYERTGVAGQDGVHGYAEKPRVPYIELDVSTITGVAVEDIDAMDDATVTAELADGRVFVLRNAWRAQTSEVNSKDGQFKVRFEGLDCLELN